MDIGFPDMTDNFLSGQDILYTQFNDVSFYIEDEDQENFYFVVLKNLFNDIRFEKIFPLNGKLNVKNEARISVNDNKRVFIVDKDFDDILLQIESLPNLFYLERYCIENYLLEEDALKRYVIEENPKTKIATLNNSFSYNELIVEARSIFKDLTSIHIVVQKFSLGIENANQSPDRFCIYAPVPGIRQDQINTYKSIVDAMLKVIDVNHNINAEMSKNEYLFTIDNPIINSLRNIPGKYLLQFIRKKIETIFQLPNRNADSFMFRIAKNCSFTDLHFLRDNVNLFLTNT